MEDGKVTFELLESCAIGGTLGLQNSDLKLKNYDPRSQSLETWFAWYLRCTTA